MKSKRFETNSRLGWNQNNLKQDSRLKWHQNDLKPRDLGDLVLLDVRCFCFIRGTKPVNVCCLK